MDFRYTPEQELYRKSIREYLEKNLWPRARAIDEAEDGIPTDITAGMAAQGMFQQVIRKRVFFFFLCACTWLSYVSCSMHVVVGTSLFQILFTCINVTILQSYLNHTVDLVLALILLLGSVIGAQLGARASKRLKADQLKILMAIIVLLVMGKMLLDLLLPPEFLLAYKGGH